MGKIRTARISDLDQIESLYGHLNPQRPPFEHSSASAILQQIIDVDEFELFLCFDKSVLVASSMLALAPNLMRGGRPHAFLENVVTHQDHRNNGHGRAVVQAALELAWQRNAHQVLLFSARPDPGVHIFYENCGFRNGRKAGYVILNPENN